jgi:dTDP-glucose pyrophosphorylase
MDENDWWTDAGTHESLLKANELIKMVDKWQLIGYLQN